MEEVEEVVGENISEGTYANNDNIFDYVRHICCWRFGILFVGQVVSQLFIKPDFLKKEEEGGRRRILVKRSRVHRSSRQRTIVRTGVMMRWTRQLRWECYCLNGELTLVPLPSSVI